MPELHAIDLGAVAAALPSAAKPVRILWQEGDSIAFVARGRAHRSEFHIDPSDEVMHMLRGDMELHYLTEAGERRVVTLREGQVLHCPAGTPHSPRFAPDAYVLVHERRRRPEEQDRFLWFCERCNALLYEASCHVADYDVDPVSRAYEDFYGDLAHRTCQHCGHVTERPA